jgi:hypothetical protein
MTVMDETVGSVWYIHFELAIAGTAHSYFMSPFTAIEYGKFVTEVRHKTTVAVG